MRRKHIETGVTLGALVSRKSSDPGAQRRVYDCIPRPRYIQLAQSIEDARIGSRYPTPSPPGVDTQNSIETVGDGAVPWLPVSTSCDGMINGI